MTFTKLSRGHPDYYSCEKKARLREGNNSRQDSNQIRNIFVLTVIILTENILFLAL